MLKKDIKLKVYKGYELLKAIADGEIKEGSRFNVYQNGELYFDNYTVYERQMLKNEGTALTDFLTLMNIVSLDFELIEDEIDIDNIKELDEWVTRRNGEITQTEGKILEIGNKTNELVQIARKLNKEIKELKEK